MSYRITLLTLTLQLVLLPLTAQDANGRITQSNTTAIYGCKLYDENSNCLGCTRDQYLSGGTCVDVPDSALIQRCNIYANLTSCFECDSGLVPDPTGKSCVVGNSALGCDIFNNSDSCKTCPAGSYLNGVSCTSIANCVSVSGQECAICAPTYYPSTSGNNSGATICAPLESTAVVTNCQYYDSNRKCAACNKGFALATDGSACLTPNQVSNQVDANCAETRVNGEGVCMLCREGHYLRNGVCQACGNSETCFICNPDNPTVCLICMPGYYQNIASGNCTLNNGVGLGQRDPLATSASLFSAFYLLVLLLIEVLV